MDGAKSASSYTSNCFRTLRLGPKPKNELKK